MRTVLPKCSYSLTAPDSQSHGDELVGCCGAQHDDVSSISKLPEAHSSFKPGRASRYGSLSVHCTGGVTPLTLSERETPISFSQLGASHGSNNAASRVQSGSWPPRKCCRRRRVADVSLPPSIPTENRPLFTFERFQFAFFCLIFCFAL